MRKERVINIRFLFCVFIGLMIGIIISKLFLMQKFGWLIAILTIIIVAGISVGGYFYGKKTRKYNAQYKARKNLSQIIMLSSIGFGCAMLVGLIISIMPFAKILLIKDYDRELTITGIVCDYVDNEETYKKFILRDTAIIENGVREELEYKIMIYTNSQTGVELGDRVSFVGELNKFKVADDYGMSSLINGIAYSTYVSSSDMIIGDGDISVKDYIHNRVYDVLKSYLNPDNAGICYAILFGQKEGLDEGISEMFSYSGISHILAVSGLHVSVLVSILWWIFNRTKMNKFVQLSIFGAILLSYAYLCSFSPSVCRACIMAFTLATCKTFKWEYDSLSSLSLAGIIILLIKPVMLFSISFQLSFMCIYSIISLAPSIEYLLSKIKCPKALASTLAISIAVNVAILPISINAFGKVSLLGIISNIFVLPIFTYVYIPLFVVAILGAIIKPLGILLYIPNLFLHLIKVIAEYISSIPFGVFRIFNVSYWMVALIVLVTLIVHFLMTRHILKSIAIVIITGVIAVLFVFNTIPAKYNGDNIIIASQYDSNVVICVSDDTVSMVGSDISYKNVLFMMKDLRLKRIDNIYAYDIQLNNILELIKICDEFGVSTVYLPEEYDYAGLRNKFKNTRLIEIGQDINNIGFGTVERSGDTIAVILECGDSSVLIPSLDNNSSENLYLKQYFMHLDYLIIDDNDGWKNIDFYDGIVHYLNDRKIIIKG